MKLFTTILCVGIFLATNCQAERYEFALAHMPPFAMKRDNGPEGIVVDLVQDVFHEMGQEVNFNFYPWARALQYLKFGRVHALAPLFESEERSRYTWFQGEGMFDMKLQFFKLAGNPIKASTLEEALPYRIAKIGKSYMGTQFSDLERKKMLHLDYVNNTLSGVKVLTSERVDLLASVKEVVEFNAAIAGLHDKISDAGDPFDTVKAFVGFSRSMVSKEFVERFNKIVERMKNDGHVDEIFNRYTGK